MTLVVARDRRRATAALLCAGAWLDGHAQVASTGRLRRIGVLGIEPVTEQSAEWRAFVDELTRRGFVAGRQVEFVHRAAGSDAQRMSQMAAELVMLNVDLIYALHGSSSALAAQKATTTVPIVFFAAGDPVGSGLVASLARPGANVTGNASLIMDVVSKSLQILFEAIGRVAPVAHIQPEGYRKLPQFAALSAALQSAAQQLGSKISFVDVDTIEQFEPTLAALAQQKVGAAVVGGGAPYLHHMPRIASHFIKHRMPTLINWPDFARAGLLVSYSISWPELARKSAGYVARILSGASPADLPVEQPAKFDLVINTRTARAIGLTVPKALLLRADEVID